MKSLDPNIYIYPYTDGKTILYSPIARKMLLMRGDLPEDIPTSDKFQLLLKELEDYVPVNQQRKVRAPEDYTLLTVLPNNTCNFSCAYCYSASGRNGATLAPEKLQAAIDFFIDSKQKGFDRPLTISFMGGGEPLMSWTTVSRAIIHARRKAEAKGLRLNIGIITNGSLVDDDVIAFCKEHKIGVSVSFDVIREVQDKWRKHYDLVSTNIRRLCDEGLKVQINSTITPDNVRFMTEMLQSIHDTYPKVDAVMFEPVTGQQLFPIPEDMRCFYENYTESFISCLRLADEWGISLTSFAYLRTVFPLDRACPGELCLTADGYFSGCYCVGSPRDALFSQTQYGEVRNGQVTFDCQKFQKLIDVNVYAKEECRQCEVKWNCGGGCFYQYHSYEKAYRDVVCDFTRLFVKSIVQHRVERHLASIPIPTLPMLINIK